MWRVDTVTTGLGGAPFYTRLFFGDTTGTPAGAVGLVFDFWSTLAPKIDNALTMTIDGIVTVVDEGTGMITGTISTGSSSTVVGTDAGLQTPEATQGLISWRTGSYVNGREVRGRTFIPGPTQSSVTNGEPAAAYQTALEAGAGILWAGTEARFGIYSTTNHVFRAAVSGQAWTEFAVLRSRRG